ncbi:MAG: ferredoxin [Candidatus Gracilibacteria bacterium]|nr:ferredoxin [Candidatus Gracilibacteria bacterium]
MSKVVVNQETCIGCGMCASMKSDIFEMDMDQGIAKVINSNTCDDADEAIAMCPVGAISCED